MLLTRLACCSLQTLRSTRYLGANGRKSDASLLVGPFGIELAACSLSPTPMLLVRGKVRIGCYALIERPNQDAN